MEKVKLNQLAKIYNGNSINAKTKADKYSTKVEGYSYVGTKDIARNGVVTYDTGVIIPFQEKDFKIAPANCVLVCSEGGSAGKKTAYNSKDICFGNKLYAITNDKGLFNAKYVYYFSRYQDFFHQFKGLMSGIIGGVSAKKFGEITIPLPEAVETQEKIVQKIDELFSELDKGIEELTTAKARLKVYRQAVLKEAFNNTSGWEKYNFSELLLEMRNGYGCKPTDCGEYKILRISSVRPLKVNLRDFRVNSDIFPLMYTIESGDLLFTRYNGSEQFVGVCACVPELSETFGFPDKLIKCKPKLKSMSHSKFLQYYFNQGEARKYIRSKIKTTSGQKGIAGSDIKKAVVFLPSLEKQEEIVLEIESRLSICDQIEATIEESLKKAESLRQSILKEAFEGRLV